MNKEIDWLGATPLETIQNRLALLKSYQPAPKPENKPYRIYNYLDDRMLPFTKYAIEKYKKLVKLNNAKLLQNLVEIKAQRFDITKIPNNPEGILTVSKEIDGKKIVKNISHREWWTIGAADSLCNMLAQCSNYIYWLYQKPKEPNNGMKEYSKTIYSQWNKYCVDFFICISQINTLERSKGGTKTAQNKSPIKAWALKQARAIRAKNKTISKREIADKIAQERYNSEDWEIPLRQYSERDTIYRWILADKTL